MKTVAVVVPTLSNKEQGYEALASIKSSYDFTWMPIIVDNWVHPDRCLSASWNYGTELAILHSCDYILIINDDVLFSPWTLTGLVNAFDALKDKGVVMVTGVNTRGSMNPQDILHIEPPTWEKPIADHSWSENPDFSCFMISKETFERVGAFDENFKPAYFEDNDYHRRINLLGYKAVCTQWAPYYHYGSVTQNKDQNNPIVNPIQFQNNRAYYMGKWGGDPGSERFEHPYNDLTLGPNRWR